MGGQDYTAGSRGYTDSLKRSRDGSLARQVPHRTHPRSISNQQNFETLAEAEDMTRKWSDSSGVHSDWTGSYQTSPTSFSSGVSYQYSQARPIDCNSQRPRTYSSSSFGSGYLQPSVASTGSGTSDYGMQFQMDHDPSNTEIQCEDLDDLVDWEAYGNSRDTEVSHSTYSTSNERLEYDGYASRRSELSKPVSTYAVSPNSSQSTIMPTAQHAEGIDPNDPYSISPGKAKPGRKGRLTEAARVKAGQLRKFPGGSCESCRKHKSSCDLRKPCKPCITRYGGRLLKDRACRGDIVENITHLLLDQVKWHPTARRETDVFGPNFQYTPYSVVIPLSLGFGTPIRKRVHVVMAYHTPPHNHVVYQWPPVSGELTTFTGRRDAVLPVVFDQNENLEQMLDLHLDVLVENDFDRFPHYVSQFSVLRTIYAMYKQYAAHRQPCASILKTAFKLLTLVHIGGDAHVDVTDANVRQILSMTPAFQAAQSVSCCFLRAQLGAVMPQLAQRYLREVVHQFAALSLDRKCENFHLVNCLAALLMMTIETIQYHAAKEGFHTNFDLAAAAAGGAGGPYSSTASMFGSSMSSPSFRPSHQSQRSCEEGAKMILHIYQACFESCHVAAFLSGDTTSASLQRQRSRSNSSGSSKYVAATQASTAQYAAAVKAQVMASRDYLVHRSGILPDGLRDMSLYFDRLLAKLFLLVIDEADLEYSTR